MTVETLSVWPARNEPGAHESLGEAVSAGLVSDRGVRAEADLGIVRGKSVRVAELWDSALVLALEEDLWLELWCAVAAVEWRVCEKKPQLTQSRDLPQVVTLDWGGEIGARRWERGALAAALEGREIQHLSATETWFFLKVEGADQYMLSHLRTQDSEATKSILFFDHDPE